MPCFIKKNKYEVKLKKYYREIYVCIHYWLIKYLLLPFIYEMRLRITSFGEGEYSMEQKELTRLSRLFEKAVENKANIIERRELSVLYQEYIDDGRQKSHQRREATHHQATA